MKKAKQPTRRTPPTEKQMAELAEAYKGSSEFCKGLLVGLMGKRLMETKSA